MSAARADTDQTADRTLEDLVSVRDAAQAVGATDTTVRTWIARGHLPAYPVLPPAPITIQVSLAAVRALTPPRDPQTPPDALPIFAVARAAGVPRALIASWMRWGLLPTWEGRHGALLRVADVRALAEQRGRLPRSDEAGEDAVALNDSSPAAPADLMSVREAARAVGMTPSAVQTWIRRGRLSAQPGPLGRRVSLADVQAIASQQPAPVRTTTRADAPMPADALVLSDAARQAGVTARRIASWATRGLLPVWRGPGGRHCVRLADVVALAERPGRALPPRPKKA